MSRSRSIFGSVATNFDSLNEPVGVAVFVVCCCCCCCCCWFLLFCLSGTCYRILAGGILLLVSRAVGFGLFVRLFIENKFFRLYRFLFRKRLGTTFS